MATKTTYTSTIAVPVYASWKCDECREINLATGVIVCKRQETTSSLRSSKHQEAEANAANRARAEWVEEAYKIIIDPNHNGSAMYNNFFLQNTNCTKCKKKPHWNKNAKYLPLFALSFGVALISGIAAFATMTSVAAWLIFIGSLSIFAWGIAREEIHKKMMVKLPKESTPVIGSLNPELVEYANRLGKKIPSPDECVEIVKGYTIAQTSDADAVGCRFCRKCGAKLVADSGFCHKCGTKIVQ